MKHRKQIFLITIGVLSLFATTLGCSLADVSQDGPSQNDLAATQVAIQSTQLALETMQLQLTQEALAAQQQPLPAEAQEAPPVQEDTQPALPDVSFEGVSLSYDDTLGRDISTLLVPSDIEENPYWGTPEHVQFELVGYPVQNDYHKPQVRVFPIEAYQTGNENAGNVVRLLRDLLGSQPENPEHGIPLLPSFNAGELGWTKVAYFGFQNGSGVRFVTQLGQAEWPFNNRGMIYTYQGITNDGRYYVSVIMPLSHPMLNDYDNYQPPNNFYDIAGDLIDSQVANLGNQPDDSFTPNIAALDAMVQSIKVEK